MSVNWDITSVETGSPSVKSIEIGSLRQWLIVSFSVSSIHKFSLPSLISMELLADEMSTVRVVGSVKVANTSSWLFFMLISPLVSSSAPKPLKMWTLRSSGSVSVVMDAVG